MTARDTLRVMLAESELDPRAYDVVVEELAALELLVPDAIPQPSAELAAMLRRPPVVALSARRTGRVASHRKAATAAAVAVTAVLGTGVAAAANTLPEPAQRLLSQLSDKFLPVHFPEPDGTDHDPLPGLPTGDLTGSNRTDPQPSGQAAKAKAADRAGDARQAGKAGEGGKGAHGERAADAKSASGEKGSEQSAQQRSPRARTDTGRRDRQGSRDTGAEHRATRPPAKKAPAKVTAKATPKVTPTPPAAPDGKGNKSGTGDD